MKKIFVFIVFVLIMSSRADRLLAADYFPLEFGNTWEFDISMNQFNTIIDIGDAKWTISGDTVISNKNLKIIECTMTYSMGQMSADTSLNLYLLDNNDGIFISANPSGESSFAKIAQHDFEEGDEWDVENTSFSVFDFGLCQVPAGQFESCFGVIAQETDTSGIFAPDIGPLSMLFTVKGIQMNLVLKSYDVKPASSGICCRALSKRKSGISPLTADNRNRTISFDLGSSGQRGRLSMFTPDGRQVKQYEIGGIGAVRIDESYRASGNILLKLDVNGKTYTERMIITK